MYGQLSFLVINVKKGGGKFEISVYRKSALIGLGTSYSNKMGFDEQVDNWIIIQNYRSYTLSLSILCGVFF